MLLAAVILAAVFQPSFKIREEPCTTTGNKNKLEEYVLHPGIVPMNTGEAMLKYNLLWVI